MHLGRFILGERAFTPGAATSKQWVRVQQLQLLFWCPPLLWLQDKFAVVVGRAFGFPQFLRFGIGVFSKVNASVSVGACGMHGTDEVWVTGKEEAAMAFGKFGHGGRVGLYVKLGTLR